MDSPDNEESTLGWVYHGMGEDISFFDDSGNPLRRDAMEDLLD